MSRAALAAGLLLVMAGTWYWALRPASPSSAPPRVPVTPVASGADGVPRVELERLTTRVPPPLAPSLTRNPFHTGGMAAAPAASVVSSPAATARSGEAAPAPRATWPRVELIGIAAARDGDDDAMARTAIVSGPHGVHHVRTGDVLEGVYRVEGVADAGLDLRLMPEGRVVRLVLRP